VRPHLYFDIWYQLRILCVAVDGDILFLFCICTFKIDGAQWTIPLCGPRRRYGVSVSRVTWQGYSVDPICHLKKYWRWIHQIHRVLSPFYGVLPVVTSVLQWMRIQFSCGPLIMSPAHKRRLRYPLHIHLIHMYVYIYICVCDICMNAIEWWWVFRMHRSWRRRQKVISSSPVPFGTHITWKKSRQWMIQLYAGGTYDRKSKKYNTTKLQFEL
jgi:hypothetical protein